MGGSQCTGYGHIEGHRNPFLGCLAIEFVLPNCQRSTTTSSWLLILDVAWLTFSFCCSWEQQRTWPGKDRQGGSLASCKEISVCSHSCITCLLVTVGLDSNDCVVLKEISCSANPLGKTCFLKCCVKWEGLIWHENPPLRNNYESPMKKRGHRTHPLVFSMDF